MTGNTVTPARSRAGAALERFERLHPRVIDLSLERIQRLLDTLGNPEAQFPPVVHIAGTNGKGSTLAFLKAALEAGGYRVHAYVSPHLVRFNERIVLAGREITDDVLADLLEECETANAGGEITFFEITSAAAFLAFARTEADILLMETGLGGRLDATNVVARPALTAITPISYDHAKFLGDDLAGIAGEKAAILKPGVPAVIGPQPGEAAQVIAARAREVGAPQYSHGAVGAPQHNQGADWQAAAAETGMSFQGRRWTLDLPPPGLAGAHQIDNAGLAVACLETLDGTVPGFPLDEAAVGRGVGGPRWPGRLQWLRRGPLVDSLPADWQLWLDGGHNGAAGEALAVMAEIWRDRPLHLVAAMLESKDPSAFLTPLAPRVTSLFAVPVPGAHAAYTPTQLARHARTAGIHARPAAGVEAALDGIAAEADGPARVLICGSLYLAGAVLEHNS